MYVVFTEELDDFADVKAHTVASLEQAFAQIVCRCGLSYRFEPRGGGWALAFTDVERPDRNPDPVFSDYRKPDDAKHDLIAQAVDGRLHGHIAMHVWDFERQRRHIQRQMGDDFPRLAHA
jgi:hypothetical protein